MKLGEKQKFARARQWRGSNHLVAFLYYRRLVKTSYKIIENVTRQANIKKSESSCKYNNIYIGGDASETELGCGEHF